MRKGFKKLLPFTIIGQTYTIGEFISMCVLSAAFIFMFRLACFTAYAVGLGVN